VSPLGKAPEAWSTEGPGYGNRINLKTAQKMLIAGEKAALKAGVPVSMAISDAGGHLLAFHRMDDAMLASVQIAIDKAYTSVFGKMSTGNLGMAFHSGELVPLFFHERWITFNGGYPIKKDGQILGGIGVSGGVIEDMYVAEAMLKAGGFCCCEVREFLKINSSNP
jgi:uncharacterized protein GlcG (DUF336 family)